MKAEIDIANATKKMIDYALVKAVAAKVIAGELKGENDNIEVSVAFVTPQKIRALNKKWRKTNHVTDVLSFSETDFLKRGSAKKLPAREFLGEIIICLEQVAKDAKERGVVLKQELAWVVAHGMLHLFGYDHKKTAEAALMRQKEQRYLAQILNPKL